MRGTPRWPTRAGARCPGRWNTAAAACLGAGKRSLALGTRIRQEREPATMSREPTARPTPACARLRRGRAARPRTRPDLAALARLQWWRGLRRTERSHGSGQPERRVSQISRISGHPNVVTLTIGGNDLGFMSILRTSSSPTASTRSSARRATSSTPHRRARAAAAGRLPGDRSGRAGAKLVVVDYPKLFPSGPRPNCAAGGSSRRRGVYLNAKIERADVAILDSARAAGATPVHISNALAGGLGCSGQRYVNRVDPSSSCCPAHFIQTGPAGEARRRGRAQLAVANR